MHTGIDMVSGTHVTGASVVVRQSEARRCLWALGVIVVSPAKSRSGSDLTPLQWAVYYVASGACDTGGAIVSGAVVDELPDPS